MQLREGIADVVCGGFPCQDVSNAGLRAGLSGARSGLYRRLVDAVRVVRPAYALLENVSALVGRGLGEVLGDLAEIGHDAEWHCVPASAVGAPHRRDRVWIVAYPDHEREPQPGGADGQIGRRFGDCGSSLADTHGPGGLRSLADGDPPGGGGFANGRPVSHPDQPRLALWESVASHDGAELQTSLGDPRWPAEPDVGRVVDGFPGRVDRLRALGNAVVPQIPELIGRAIMAEQGVIQHRGARRSGRHNE
jgi:DNA (cytosine-5)-methyltransferase 1